VPYRQLPLLHRTLPHHAATDVMTETG